jgi:hypothetical protein
MLDKRTNNALRVNGTPDTSVCDQVTANDTYQATPSTVVLLILPLPRMEVTGIGLYARS